MLKEIIEFIEDHHIVKKDEKLLVAVSGGIDSVVLGYLLRKLQYKITLIHCNFQLRGEESDKDELFVEALASKWEVNLFTKRFDTQELSDTEGISIQMAARNQRYQWFEEVYKQHDFNKIVTAHHLSDHVETILFNLTRGTGLTGLQGIPIIRENIIRPLLFASKEQIISYAKDEGLEWREDQSNSDNKYQRNLIRREVIPLLKKINPNLEISINRTSSYLSQVGKVFEEEMSKIADIATLVEGNDVTIYLDKIENQNRVEAFLSFKLLKYSFNQFQINAVLKNLSGTGVLFYSSTHVLNIDRGSVLISTHQSDTEFYELDSGIDLLETRHHNLKLAQFEYINYQINKSGSVAAFDLNALHYPLIIRNWKDGDYFTPLGMEGKKKLSDFMIDRKIPLNLKKRQLVLSSNNEIVWVIGQQISNNFKITEKTTTVLEIKVSQKNVQSI